MNAKKEHDSVRPGIRRHVRSGGVHKSELIRQLSERQIETNVYAEQLFADERFTTSDVRILLPTIELSVGELGFPEGATLPQVFEKAAELGFQRCPLELAPHLRLQYGEQSDGGSASLPGGNQAPQGSASEPLSDDHKFPKGFYLRKIDGMLWLRGYCCDFEHVWQESDRFVFVDPS